MNDEIRKLYDDKNIAARQFLPEYNEAFSTPRTRERDFKWWYVLYVPAAVVVAIAVWFTLAWLGVDVGNAPYGT